MKTIINVCCILLISSCSRAGALGSSIWKQERQHFKDNVSIVTTYLSDDGQTFQKIVVDGTKCITWKDAYAGGISCNFKK